MTLLSTAVVLIVLQVSQQTSPQAQQPAKVGIEGFVLRAGTNEPLARARITISRMATNTGAPVQPTQTSVIPAITTDGQGRFSVRDLEPGSYALIAQRNGFARQS